MIKRVFFFTFLMLFTAAGFLPPTVRADDTPWIHIEVMDGDDALVRVNLPLSLVDVALEVAEDEMLYEGNLELDNCDVSVADLRRMWKELRDAGDAEFLTVEEDDEIVRIFRKDDFIYVEVDDRHQDDEKVRMEIPVQVIDVLLEGEGETLNLRAAFAELQKLTGGQIISIRDGSESVRIWIE
jgi:hypothetical protein